MLISTLIASFMGAIAKILTQSFPAVEVVFFRSFFGLLFILFSFFAIPVKQIGGKPLMLFVRSFFGLLAMSLFFYNVATISLAEAVIYSLLAPLFIVIFAYVFLKEKLNKLLLLAVLLGFLGMLCVMQPINFVFEKSHIFGFLNAICAAIAFTSIKELKKYYDTRIIVLHFMVFATIATALVMFASEYYILDASLKFITPKIEDWLLIVGLGVTSALAQIYMTKSYGATDASIASVVSYSVIIFSMILGLLLGDPIPNLLTIFGIILIIFSGVIVAIRKN